MATVNAAFSAVSFHVNLSPGLRLESHESQSPRSLCGARFPVVSQTVIKRSSKLIRTHDRRRGRPPDGFARRFIMTTTLLDLDDDALEAVLCSTSLRALGNLMCASKALNSTLKSQALLDRLCESRNFSSGPSTHSPSTATQFHCSSDVVDSLEAVAVLEEMSSPSLGKNHVSCVALRTYVSSQFSCRTPGLTALADDPSSNLTRYRSPSTWPR